MLLSLVVSSEKLLVGLLLTWLRVILLLCGTLRAWRSLGLATGGASGGAGSVVHVLLRGSVDDNEVVLAVVVVYVWSHEIQLEVVISLLDIVKLLLFYRALVLFIMLYVVIINCLMSVEMVNYFYVLTCLSTLGLLSNRGSLALLVFC